MVAIALALVSVVSAGLIGALASYGAEATAPFHYTITGTVQLPSGAYATGAVVVPDDGRGRPGELHRQAQRHVLLP